MKKERELLKFKTEVEMTILQNVEKKEDFFAPSNCRVLGILERIERRTEWNGWKRQKHKRNTNSK